MKKNFLKVFSLLLVISMLSISVNAVVTDKPQSKITIAAPEQVTLYGDEATVTVTLTMPICYAIEGQWTATDGLSMATLVADNNIALSNDGAVVWADVEGTDETKWFNNPMTKMTATYTVGAAGSYTVSFTCTVFAGGQRITDGDIAVVEGTFVYSKTIQVVKHVCSDVTTDNDHKCDDPLCGKDNVTEHEHKTYGSDETQHWSICDCGQMVGEKAAHTGGTATCMAQAVCETCEREYGALADHAWGEASYTDNGDGTHTASYTCGTNPAHTKSDDPVAHDFNNGDCICGSKKPGLKGDVNLDGQVSLQDAVLAAKYYMDWDTNPITDPQILYNADFNGDGMLSLTDAVEIAKYYMDNN